MSWESPITIKKYEMQPITFGHESPEEISRKLQEFTEKAAGGETYWRDKEGYEFSTDMGYFFEGLYAMEDYLIDRLRTPEVKEAEDGSPTV